MGSESLSQVTPGLASCQISPSVPRPRPMDTSCARSLSFLEDQTQAEQKVKRNSLRVRDGGCALGRGQSVGSHGQVLPGDEMNCERGWRCSSRSPCSQRTENPHNQNHLVWEVFRLALALLSCPYLGLNVPSLRCCCGALTPKASWVPALQLL